MLALKKIIKILKKPKSLFFSLGYRGYFKWLPDKIYLKIIYRMEIGKKLNLENPVTYNEKIQWLKLYDRNPLYSLLSDKYEVRNFVAEKIGESYLIPLLEVYNNVEEINFENLPEKFVLKCTHDSGGVIVCSDKSKLNFRKAKKYLKSRMKRNFYWGGREWPYKNIKPRIIAEKYMVDQRSEELADYKFFCFDGKAKALYVATDRGIGKTKFDYFDMEFNHMPFQQYYPNSDKEIKKPKKFKEMVELAEILAEGMKHVRIDFYEVNGEIYFGEFTFYHFSGVRKFIPNKYDKLFGDWININK